MQQVSIVGLLLVVMTTLQMFYITYPQQQHALSLFHTHTHFQNFILIGKSECMISACLMLSSSKVLCLSFIKCLHSIRFKVPSSQCCTFIYGTFVPGGGIYGTFGGIAQAIVYAPGMLCPCFRIVNRGH